jgi:cellulose synthase/poly-beta-1,6-N-acetylglucosamine synthase-like glycosyltransferase
MDWAQFGQTAFAVVYFFCLGMVCLYGLHRYVLVFLYYRHRRNLPARPDQFEELPHVTVQLPICNERLVAKRVIEAACQLDYPRDKLDIQVLDDSSDAETQEIIQATVAQAQADGLDIAYIRRGDRKGYKAGNLANGLKQLKGEFVTIFDADFIPAPNILRESIHYFTDPKVAVVQSRWEHLNRDLSLLTKSQAILLDGHFAIEQVARNRSNRFMCFNGTAGTWRVEAITASGGWHFDTLTEDLDLSFRAQMKGWKFIYLPHLTAPAELPMEMTGFKDQQFRWTKGGVQTAMKLLPKVLMSKLPWRVKLEGFFHLTGYTLYIYTTALMIMMFPAMALRTLPDARGAMWRTVVDACVIILATMSGSVYYMAGQLEIRRNWRTTLKFMPVLMALGLGICLSNVKAVFEALLGKSSEFVPTPKYGSELNKADAMANASVNQPKVPKRQWLPYVELVMAVYMAFCAGWSFRHLHVGLIGAPFLLLFAFGYFWVSLTSFHEIYARRRAMQSLPSTVTTKAD